MFVRVSRKFEHGLLFNYESRIIGGAGGGEEGVGALQGTVLTDLPMFLNIILSLNARNDVLSLKSPRIFSRITKYIMRTMDIVALFAPLAYWILRQLIANGQFLNMDG